MNNNFDPADLFPDAPAPAPTTAPGEPDVPAPAPAPGDAPAPTDAPAPAPAELKCCGRGDACPHDWLHPELPPALAKAVADPHRYAAFIAGFGTVEFVEAVDLGNGWLRLFGIGRESLPEPLRCVAGLKRGLDVPISAVLAAADLE